MDKVILTKRFHNEVVKKLENEFELIIAEETDTPFLQLIEENSDCKALIPFLSDKVDKSVINSFPDLKVISNYAVGYNNIDVNEARRRGIYVTNTPDILTDATADLTFALILAVARKIPESDGFMRNGNFKGWGANLFLGKELKGAVLGIVGLGKIGTAVAERAIGFGMEVIYFSRSLKPELESKFGFESVGFKELIERSDIISLHLPYSEEVHHMFNKDVFCNMKKDSIFINVARGAIVNEEDLTDSLEEGRLSGAGLDVFEFEPLVNKRLTKLNNVVMTPHIGSATFKARLGMAEKVYNNVKAALSGDIPPDLVRELRKKGGEL